MLPDRESNPGPLTYESGALPTALRGRPNQVVTALLRSTAHSSSKTYGAVTARKLQVRRLHAPSMLPDKAKFVV